MIDDKELKEKVKVMYQKVATEPKGEFHFEMGRKMAERLGYSAEDLDKIPAESIDSFAGVGFHFGFADLKEGERVLDLGSGSGMDTFVASLKADEKGLVTGIDMTDAQINNAESLRQKNGFGNNIIYVNGLIEKLPFPDGTFDVVISNGVINLISEKEAVFKEIARVLKVGGRLAISDIVTEKELTENIVCDTTLWASCIGGAMQIDRYKETISNSGMEVKEVKDNPEYQFLSNAAQGATEKFGVKSISLLAVKN